MLQLRITVLRDKPDPELLNEHPNNGYHLYRDGETGLFFLEDGYCDDFQMSGFGSEYNRNLNIPFELDKSALKSFKKANKKLLGDTILHYEILKDALALSQTFSTRVLCVYSNDEDCDFAVTAENGELLRLRFKAGREQGKRVDDEIARQIKTEIQATRILADGEELDPDEVHEYTAYEVLQTQNRPLALKPYWRFREGEIGGQVIFDTLSADPEGTEPSLLFRNAFLEFENAFGKTPPDFTDMQPENRFQLIEAQPAQKSLRISPLAVLGAIFRRPKLLLGIGAGLFVLYVGLFGDDSPPTAKENTFASHCMKAGGTINGEHKNKCDLDGRIYRNWNLPGQKGERRIMILEIGPNKADCTGLIKRECLIVDSELFYDHIEGFTFRPGQEQIVPVERIQTCDPEISNDCPQDGSIYKFKQLLDLGK